MMALDICLDRKSFLEQICRACSRYYSYDGSEEEKMEFYGIFKDEKPQLTDGAQSGDESGYVNAVEACGLGLCEEIKEIFQEIIIWNLNIKPGDGLPQQICRDCMERFRSVKIFREECLDTQKVLESYFKDFSLLTSKSPKTESVKSEPSTSPTPPFFNPDDLVEEIPESSPEHRQSPTSSPKLQHSPKFTDTVYAESSMGTPPPIFEEIKTEPIDVRTMEIIKAEADLQLESKPSTEIKEEEDEDGESTTLQTALLSSAPIAPQKAIRYSSSDDESSTPTTDDESDHASSNPEEFESTYGNINLIDPRYDPRNPLQCKICFNIFPKRSLLKEHQVFAHPEDKPYACNLCPSTFKTNFMLSQHKLKHNRLDSIRCELCSKYFRSQLHLQRHTKNFHLTSTYTCHICHAQLEKYTQIRFQYHVRQHGEKRFHCNFCDKSFHQKIHLVNHERTHTKEQPFRCDICGKSYRQQTACQEHMLTHSDPTPFKCKICEKGFTQRSSLRLHYRTHSGNKPYHCDLCGQNFAQKVHLEVHQLTHKESNAYQCEICNQKFRILSQLTSHIQQLHTASGDDVTNCCFCDHCNALFPNQTHLDAHMENVHYSKRQHSCVFCRKTFALAANLKSHMKTHAQTYKTFKCQYCDKCFKNNQALQLHEQMHAEDKQFKCSFCDQSFLYRASLCQHMRTHLENQSTPGDNEEAESMEFNTSI